MSDVIEVMARGMCAESRPKADPDALTPGPRGSVGSIPKWALFDPLARAARAALTAAGYVVVPVEPTEAMVDAGADAVDRTDFHGTQGYTASEAWRAMIKAAQP